MANSRRNQERHACALRFSRVLRHSWSAAFQSFGRQSNIRQRISVIDGWIFAVQRAKRCCSCKTHSSVISTRCREDKKRCSKRDGGRISKKNNCSSRQIELTYQKFNSGFHFSVTKSVWWIVSCIRLRATVNQSDPSDLTIKTRSE